MPFTMPDGLAESLLTGRVPTSTLVDAAPDVVRPGQLLTLADRHLTVLSQADVARITRYRRREDKHQAYGRALTLAQDNRTAIARVAAGSAS